MGYIYTSCYIALTYLCNRITNDTDTLDNIGSIILSQLTNTTLQELTNYELRGHGVETVSISTTISLKGKN